MSKAERKPGLEQGTLLLMQALDSQIARDLERSPVEREVHGVQKWKPYDERVERLAGFVLEALGDNEVGLDSLLVCARAFAKSLQLAVEELGVEGLGELRTAYCFAALEDLSRTSETGLQALKAETPQLM